MRLALIPMFMKWDGPKDFFVHVAWKEEFALEYKDLRFVKDQNDVIIGMGPIAFAVCGSTLRSAGRRNKCFLYDCK